MDNRLVSTFLPERIRTYLNERGITDAVLQSNRITWDGERIVIPIFNADGVWLHNKYRRDPAVSHGAKYTYDKGASAALYGVDKVAKAKQVIIVEGEFDALLLEAQGLVAVSSTGGAGTFKKEWLDLLQGKDLYACFDNDMAGRKGLVRLTKMDPTIKFVALPAEVGEHGDITDFFVRLEKKRKDFDILMKVAEPLVLPPEPKPKKTKYKAKTDDKLDRAKAVPLDKVLEFNRAGFAKCPFHNEKTPSLHWIKKSNKYYCFGCAEKGDGIDLVMQTKYFDKMPAAIDYLLSL